MIHAQFGVRMHRLIAAELAILPDELVTLLAHELVAEPKGEPAMPSMSLPKPWASVLPSEARGSQCDGLAA